VAHGTPLASGVDVTEGASIVPSGCKPALERRRARVRALAPRASEDMSRNFDAEAPFVAALRRGDAAAYERLVEEAGPYLRSVARRFLAEPHDVEDVVQATYLSAFRSVRQFSASSTLLTWLHRIVSNHALMLLRSRRRRPETLLDERGLAAVGDRGGGLAFRPVDACAAAETAVSVHQALDGLSRRMRAAFRLRVEHGVSAADVAIVLDRTPSSVRMHLQRGRPLLRAALASSRDESHGPKRLRVAPAAPRRAGRAPVRRTGRPHLLVEAVTA